MKTLPKFVLLVVATLSASCMIGNKGIAGSGNVVKETRNLSGFKSIRVEKGIEVSLEQNQGFEVVVEADDNLQAHIVTKVENGTLVITSEYNSWTNSTKKVFVKMPMIETIDVGGGASLKSKNVLRGDEMTIKSSGGGSIGLNVESDKIIAESSSGSHISLRGKALTFDSSSSSGSEISAENLIANDISAQSSSGSSINVHAAVSIDASASSGSSISYKGKPTKVTVDESSGGSVSGR